MCIFKIGLRKKEQRVRTENNVENTHFYPPSSDEGTKNKDQRHLTLKCYRIKSFQNIEKYLFLPFVPLRLPRRSKPSADELLNDNLEKQ
jgi:hypothetical protein